MATDGPTPQDCHGEAYEGPEVFQTYSIGGSNAVERWVRKIAATSGQLVDWHFAGGCVIVRASARADMDRVRYAIGVHMAEHDAMWSRHFSSLGLDATGYPPPRPSWWSEEARRG